MINLYTNVDTGSIAIWPVTGSVTGSTFSMELTHDMDLASSSFSLSLTNTPNNLSKYYEFTYTGSAIPTASGQYTYNLRDNQGSGQLKWGQANKFFSTIQSIWSNVEESTGLPRNIDTGRAFVFGTNDPTFTNYITSNEDGAYITYNS